MAEPASEIVADAVVARIRELAHAHGATIRDDATLGELVATLKLGDQVPLNAFAVAAELLFHLLIADQRPEAAP